MTSTCTTLPKRRARLCSSAHEPAWRFFGGFLQKPWQDGDVPVRAQKSPPKPAPKPHPKVRSAADALRRSTGALSTAATARMDADLPWFKELSAEDRSWVGLIVQAGVRAFVDWFREGAG